MVNQTLKAPTQKKVTLLTDCQSALQAVTGGTPQKNHTELIASIHKSVETLEAKGADVSITWIAGHTGLNGNELVDLEAKKGAYKAVLCSINAGH